ncbi:hypothetical protein J1N35_015322 [Gossypium stocksii]|uniref:Aminotransferase-like plant mobile domain-containing protein n=1 Tax=Gossypium stocksii TaxID=47602 RepID=A0A9D3VY56_9ROSI|nr:hypothetical protein J1N35_015322 [Gossypium stocksii]
MSAQNALTWTRFVDVAKTLLQGHILLRVFPTAIFLPFGGSNGRGCNLDPKLINVLIESWRPETHTFYLLCRKCTITLEDVQLQLGLSMDGFAFTGSVQSADWGAVWYDFLGAIRYNIYEGQIEMG